MKQKLVNYACGICLLGAATITEAQSTWNYVISDAGNGNSLVTWSATGDLTTFRGASMISGSPFQAVYIYAPDIFADSYLSDGTPQPIPTPDGSYFVQNFGALVLSISAYETYTPADANDDGFSLLTSLGSSGSGDNIAGGNLIYYPGTQSVIIPVDFSDFNPGIYQSEDSGFSSPFTVNLTVESVPEPSSLSLTVMVWLGGLLLYRRCKSPFALAVPRDATAGVRAIRRWVWQR